MASPVSLMLNDTSTSTSGVIQNTDTLTHTTTPIVGTPAASAPPAAPAPTRSSARRPRTTISPSTPIHTRTPPQSSGSTINTNTNSTSTATLTLSSSGRTPSTVNGNKSPNARDQLSFPAVTLNDIDPDTSTTGTATPVPATALLREPVDKAAGTSNGPRRVELIAPPVIDISSSPPAPAPEVDVGQDVSMEEEDGEEDEEVEGEMAGDEDDEGEEGSGDEEEGEDDEEDSEEEDSEDDEGDEEEDIELVGAHGPNGSADPQHPPTVKSEPLDPSEQPAEGAVDGEAVNTLIPKKKSKKKRERSTSEDMPAPPPPMKTIRLEKELLPEGTTLEWNVLEDAQALGMAFVWAPPIEDEPEPEEGGMDIDGTPTAPPGEILSGPGPGQGSAGGGILGGMFDNEELSPEEIARRLEEKYDKPNKRKAAAKKKVKDDYDFKDEFIDDSEIAIDDPTHFMRPKKEGYFVHSGPLELLEVEPERAARKAGPRKSNRPLVAEAVVPPQISLAAETSERLGSYGQGSQFDPVEIDSDGELKAGPSRSPQKVPKVEVYVDVEESVTFPVDRLLFKTASQNPKYLPPFAQFPAEVKDALNLVRYHSLKHDWNPNGKSKFPDHLKKYIKIAGEAAFRHDMFSDREPKEFFMALPSVLPYNQFTLTKLFTKTCHDSYWKFMQECENTGIARMQRYAEEERAPWERKYEESKQKYDVELAAWQEQQASDPTSSAAPTAQPTQTSNPDENETGQQAPRGPKVPFKQFTWSANIREVFAQLMENYQDMVTLNTRLTEWGVRTNHSDKENSEQNLKQRLYKRIVECFPDGYCNTSGVSREASRIKTGKQQKNQGGDGVDLTRITV